MSNNKDFFEEEFNMNLHAAEQAYIEAEKDAQLHEAIIKVTTGGELFLENETTVLH